MFPSSHGIRTSGLTIAVVLCTLLLAVPAICQTITGTILGAVRDSSGGVLPGVEVIVQNGDTNISKHFTTDQTGNYLVPLLKPGKYRVTASAAGFKTSVQEGVVLQVEQQARVDITLEIGQIDQKVEVVSYASVISTDSASVGQVIDNRRVRELPLNGRNFIQLTYVAPGAVRGVGTNADIVGQGGSVSVNGGRVQNNNFMIDGTDDNEILWGGLGLNISVEAIQEFKVQSNSYSAEFGRAGAAQINVTTKSGTNQFRGDLFEFLRNDKMDARNFFAASNPALKRNQFGGTLGGPVTLPRIYNGRNRTFFFISYEGIRLRQGSTQTTVTPTTAQRQGNFSGGTAVIDPLPGVAFPGNVIPAARIDPIASGILKQFYPLPNLATASPNFSSSFSNTETGDQFTVRLDHRFSEKDSLFGRYSVNDDKRFTPSVFNNFGNSENLFMTNTTLDYVHLFGTHEVNEFRFGFNRPAGGLRQNQAFGHDFITPLGIQGIVPVSAPQDVSFPTTSIAGFAGIGPSYSSPIADFPNFYDFNDNFTYISGKHSFRMGAEIKRSQQNNQTGVGINGQLGFTPTFTRGSALADFLLGLPSSSQIANGDTREYLRSTAYYPYFQDDWKISSRLTLNLGVRYEYNSPWVEKQNRLSGFAIAPNLHLISLIAGQNGVSRSILKANRNDWGPRLGFAYRPTNDNKTVIRGGYGIFYNQVITNAQYILRENPPFFSTRSYVSSPAAPVLTLRDPFPGYRGSPLRSRLQRGAEFPRRVCAAMEL